MTISFQSYTPRSWYSRVAIKSVYYGARSLIQTGDPSALLILRQMESRVRRRIKTKEPGRSLGIDPLSPETLFERARWLEGKIREMGPQKNLTKFQQTRQAKLKAHAMRCRDLARVYQTKLKDHHEKKVK